MSFVYGTRNDNKHGQIDVKIYKNFLENFDVY